MLPNVGAAKVTVPAELVRLCPLASLNCTVRTLVATPFAVIDAGYAVTTEVVALAGPCIAHFRDGSPAS